MLRPNVRWDFFTKTLYADNTILTQGKRSTYLSADIASGGTFLTVQSITNINTTAKILLLGEIGQEKTEIVYPSHATAPTGTTIYLYGSTTFSHPQDTKVTILDWDQICFCKSTTTSSEKSTMMTSLIDVDMFESMYGSASISTGYGYVEFKNTVPTVALYSPTSDPVPFAGYGDNTVFMIKKRALEQSGEEISDLITHDYLNDCLWEARREYHNMPGKRPFRVIMNNPYATTSIGMYRVPVPSDLDEPTSAKNLYGVRIGKNSNLAYTDKKDMDIKLENAVMTTVATAYVVASAYFQVNDSRDLASSGSVQCEEDTIAYSANDITRGVLSVSTAGSSAHPLGKEVYQNIDTGLPQYFTVAKDIDGTIYITFDCPIGRNYYNNNIWVDYYRTVVAYDSDADELDEPEYDMYVPYLKFRIKQRKIKGAIASDRTGVIIDADYNEWIGKKMNALANEHLGADIRFKPDIPI